MRGRTSTSQLASHLARKHQEDVFWLESDKSAVWYSVDVSASSSSYLQSKYIQMFEVSSSCPDRKKKISKITNVPNNFISSIP